MTAVSLSVVILTHNEAIHLARAIQSVQGVAAQIVVVDSFSTDDTVAIARAWGSDVVQRRFVSQAEQFQWALDHVPITSDWIMRLDADEVVEPDLAAEIAARLPTLPADVVGINLQRKHLFMGRWIRHGGRYPLTLLRLWRRGQGRIEKRWMDEHMVVRGGRTLTFSGGFADHNLQDLSFFTAKHNAYATREAIDVLNRRYGLFDAEDLTRDGTSRQAATKRWLKQNVYNRMPFWAGPLGYFAYRYVVQAGFLDGPEGLVYHVLQGFWYRFLVAAKVVEFDRAIRPLAGPAERLEALSRLTGYRLADQEA